MLLRQVSMSHPKIIQKFGRIFRANENAKKWAEAVSQLAERSLPTSRDPGSKPANSNFFAFDVLSLS